jgi:hypothetical protein
VRAAGKAAIFPSIRSAKGGLRTAVARKGETAMRVRLYVILAAACVPAMALAFTDYVDDYVDEVAAELEEWGLPVGDGAGGPAAVPDEPAAPTPAEPAAPGAPPGTTVKTDYTPYGKEDTTLIVTSTPPGAAVTVDGREAGHTPTYFTDLAPGAHRVTVAKVADEVELRPGGVTHLDVTCAAQVGKSPARDLAGNYVDNRDNYVELHFGE